MQLKLLNFYRIISTIATNILGAFVALLIYQNTNNFSLAFAYVVASQLLKSFLQKVLYKFLTSKPQLMLLLRIIPFILYSLSLTLLYSDLMILAIFLVLIFQSLSDIIGSVSIEYVFSYSAEGKSSSSTAITRTLEVSGKMLAILIGGTLLDNVDLWIVISIACVTYMISIIPLFSFYIKQHHTQGFNMESTSNATESFNQNDLKRIQHKFICNRTLKRYYFVYFLMCTYDSLMTLVSLYLFKENAQMYSYAAYIQMAHWGCYGLGSIIAGALDQKIDLTSIVVLFNIAIGILACVMPFVIQYLWLEIVISGIIGFMLSTISLFLYSRMITRCKILGISNAALAGRSLSSNIAQTTIGALCLPGAFMFVPAFFAIGISAIFNAYALPKNEEIIRNYIVDYLQNNQL